MQASSCEQILARQFCAIAARRFSTASRPNLLFGVVDSTGDYHLIPLGKLSVDGIGSTDQVDSLVIGFEVPLQTLPREPSEDGRGRLCARRGRHALGKRASHVQRGTCNDAQ